jgi:hypothetical protein
MIKLLGEDKCFTPKNVRTNCTIIPPAVSLPSLTGLGPCLSKQASKVESGPSAQSGIAITYDLMNDRHLALNGAVN